MCRSFRAAAIGAICGGLAFAVVAASDPHFGLYEILVSGVVGGAFWGTVIAWVRNLWASRA
jgi:ABC-type uncharacterized transport system permease subunit